MDKDTHDKLNKQCDDNLRLLLKKNDISALDALKIVCQGYILQTMLLKILKFDGSFPKEITDYNPQEKCLEVLDQGFRIAMHCTHSAETHELLKKA